VPDFGCAEARAVWAALEFRSPALLRYVAPLDDGELRWRPPGGGNSVGWQLWHIAEVEDNWVRQLLLGEPRRYPFGASVRDAADHAYPPKRALLAYLAEARRLSRDRLAALGAGDFERPLEDAHFGTITVREMWAGVVTSFAWHAGQVPLTIRLLRALRDGRAAT